MQINIPDLIPGKTYKVRLRGVTTDGGVSEWSRVYEFAVPSNLPVAQPINPSSIVITPQSDKSFLISWDKVENTGTLVFRNGRFEIEGLSNKGLIKDYRIDIGWIGVAPKANYNPSDAYWSKTALGSLASRGTTADDTTLIPLFSTTTGNNKFVFNLDDNSAAFSGAKGAIAIFIRARTVNNLVLPQDSVYIVDTNNLVYSGGFSGGNALSMASSTSTANWQEGGLQLSWNPVANASSYKIDITSTSGSTKSYYSVDSNFFYTTAQNLLDWGGVFNHQDTIKYRIYPSDNFEYYSGTSGSSVILSKYGIPTQENTTALSNFAAISTNLRPEVVQTSGKFVVYLPLSIKSSLQTGDTVNYYWTQGTVETINGQVQYNPAPVTRNPNNKISTSLTVVEVPSGANASLQHANYRFWFGIVKAGSQTEQFSQAFPEDSVVGIKPGPIVDVDSGYQLIAENVKSGSYVSNTSGWQINKSGSAEFNNLLARGVIVAKSGTFVESLKVGNALGNQSITLDGSDPLVGKIFIGNGQYFNTGTGFYVDGTGNFSLSDRLGYSQAFNLLQVNGGIRLTYPSVVEDNFGVTKSFDCGKGRNITKITSS